MATHTIEQGETLLRIARRYGLGRVAALYDHPCNEAFRALRPNPDLVYPGDRIVIPSPDDRPGKVGVTNRQNVFLKTAARETLRLRLKGGQGKRAVLTVNGQTLESTVDDRGLLEFELPVHAEATAELALYLSEPEGEPSHQWTVKLAYLDPIDTLSGIQARCNSLGFDCGIVDGVMGPQTRQGVKRFQASAGLSEDGEPGPKTQQKLEEHYGL